MPAIPSSLTLNYDAVLASTLFKYRKTLENQISSGNKFFYFIKKQGNWKKTASLGDRLGIPLMYEQGQADSYSGYDQLDTTPMDGLTMGFFDWRQASVPIAISGIEEKKNTGEAQILDLFKVKIKQAQLGLEEFFAKAFLQGAGGTSIVTPYTSAMNGSVFIDPLPLLVKYDPTSNTSIGNINQLTHTWWANQYKASGGSTFAAFEAELRHMFNNCSKGIGGPPKFHLVDQSVFEVYEAALASRHYNTSYRDADLPFDNIKFRGGPVVWDEFVPDVANGSTTQSTSSGTWYMLNPEFMGLTIHSGTDFVPTPFQKPENQDAKVAHILVICSAWISNRRKLGVVGSIDTTLTS